MIKETGIAREVNKASREMLRAGAAPIDVTIEAVKKEMGAVENYLKQLIDEVPAMNRDEMRHFTCALMLYTEHTWKAAESVLGSELMNFWDLVQEVFSVSTTTASINTKKAEEELRGMKDE